MKIYIIIILGIVAVLTARAQKCGSSLNMPLIKKENPTLYNSLLQIENHTSKFINNQQSAQMLLCELELKK